MRVLISCEFSGTVRDAFIKAGHDAVSCDLLETEKEGPHYQGDVFDMINDGWDLMIAHPPCTRLANSGVRWLTVPPKGKTLQNMHEDFLRAVDFYKKLRDAPIPKKCIENPVMHGYAKRMIGSLKRKVVQPHYFGQKMFKATGYELFGLPNLERTHHMQLPKKGTEEHKKWSWVHRCPPGPDRWKIRSRTPEKIAEAMASQWG